MKKRKSKYHKIEKICERCCNTFITMNYPHSNKFCTRKCMYNALHDKVAKYEWKELTCELCGKKFFPKRRNGINQRFCTHKCSSIHAIIERKKDEEKYNSWKNNISEAVKTSEKYRSHDYSKIHKELWASGKETGRRGQHHSEESLEKIRVNTKLAMWRPDVREKYLAGQEKARSEGRLRYRSIRSFQGNYKGTYYDSSFELARFLQLEDLKINYVRGDCFPIKYTNYNRYYPDILREDKILEEVKPSDDVKNDINRKKFIAANKFCKENGLIFKVITEKHIGKKYLKRALILHKILEKRT